MDKDKAVNQEGYNKFSVGSMRRGSYGSGSRGAPRGNSNMNRGENFSSRGSGFGSRGGGDSDGYRRGGPAGGGSNFNNLKSKQPGGTLRKPKWENETLQPFQKNFYTPHPLVLNRYLFIIVLYLHQHF